MRHAHAHCTGQACSTPDMPLTGTLLAYMCSCSWQLHHICTEHPKAKLSGPEYGTAPSEHSDPETFKVSQGCHWKPRLSCIALGQKSCSLQCNGTLCLQNPTSCMCRSSCAAQMDCEQARTHVQSRVPAGGSQSHKHVAFVTQAMLCQSHR